MAELLLLLLRHAAHDRVDDVLCGRMPGVHLGAAGMAQAARLAGRLVGLAPAAVHSSPQPRAVETASLLAARCDVPLLPAAALDEIDCGDWTGRRFADLTQDPEWQRWNAERGRARPPGGESMAAAQHRAIGWAARLAASGTAGTIAAVSHADVIKAMLMAVLGLPLDAHWRLEVAPASISAIRWRDATPTVAWINERCP